MKDNRIAFGILCFLLAGALFGLAVTGWRTVDYAVRLQLPLHAVWFGVKAVCFVGISVVGICLVSLLRQYNQQGYFDYKSVNVVQGIGVATGVVAVFNSIFHVLTDQVIAAHATKLPLAGQLLSRLVVDLFYESPVLFFISLFVFLLSSFMKKAIQVKQDAESFI